MDYAGLIIQKWGMLPNFRKVGNEWKSSCPVCGSSGRDPFDKTEPDRFHIHLPDHILPIPRGVCRKCGHFETIEGIKITPAQRTAIKLHEVSHRRQVENDRQKRLKDIQREAYWRGFHDGMSSEQRAIWRLHGIEDDVQDLFTLGYNNDKVIVKDDGNLLHTEALTIPYMRSFDGQHKPVNVAHRLLHPYAISYGGKYRYEYGVPAALYIVEPDKQTKGNVLVVEGAKKAIICWLHVGNYFTNVIGLPSADIAQSLAEELRVFEEVCLFLDPDTYEVDKNNRVIAEETAHKIGKSTRLVRPSLDIKPDDLLLMYSDMVKARDDFMKIVDSATPLST